MNSYVLEVCVDSMASALAAQDGGAHRIELCASLAEGGLTPSAATVEIARKNLTIDINIMIRPRGGDFLYSDLELAIMQHDIEIAKANGAAGVVIGILNPDGSVDFDRTKSLVELARPMSVTFHRAFDLVSDSQSALEDLIHAGVDRVLTSGLRASVSEGATTVAALHRQAGGRIIVMPGAGISEGNIAEMMRLTGANEFHMSGRVSQESLMQYRNPHISLGSSQPTPEYGQQVTSAARISAAIDALRMTDQKR